jgi:hypothetical protein
MERGRKGFFVAGLCICLASSAGLVLLRAGQVRAAASGAAPGEREGPDRPEHLQREQELEALHRQDLARDLKARGVTARWQDHDLAELLDWRDRIDAARALATEFGVKVDWRSETAAVLTDMRLRAAKAVQLRTTYGIIVDWRRYSWAQIEGLRLSLVALMPQAAGSGGAHSGAAATATPVGAQDPDALAPFDPDRRHRLPVRAWKDPDAILEPMFASAAASRSERRFGLPHPDGLLEPTFPRHLPRPSDRARDALIDPGSRR